MIWPFQDNNYNDAANDSGGKTPTYLGMSELIKACLRDLQTKAVRILIWIIIDLDGDDDYD